MDETYAVEFRNDRNSTGWMRWQEYPTETGAVDAAEEMALGEYRIVAIQHGERIVSQS